MFPSGNERVKIGQKIGQGSRAGSQKARPARRALCHRSLTFHDVTVRSPSGAIQVASRAGTCHLPNCQTAMGTAPQGKPDGRLTGGAARRPAVGRRSRETGVAQEGRRSAPVRSSTPPGEEEIPGVRKPLGTCAEWIPKGYAGSAARAASQSAGKERTEPSRFCSLARSRSGP